MSAGPAGPVTLSLQDLSVELPDGRRLFDGANLEVRAGEFVLLVGPSGSGKTTLLRLIAGLDDADERELKVSGRITIAGESGPRSPRSVGLVFQNHALFDELSAVRNVQFALDHRHDGRPAAPEEAASLLKLLGVPTATPLDRLSGGERQRVAVARTLAMNPPILLFDEPTTGLDPARAAAVADLIAETHQRLGRTVVVVTHDFRPFLPHAPRFVLADSLALNLRDVAASELQTHFEAVSSASRSPPQSVGRSPASFPVLAWLEGPGNALLTLLALAPAVAGGWSRPRWKLRYLWHYLRMVALGTTTIYVALAGAMLGFVFTSFSFAQLPYSKVTVPLLTEEFLAATGYSTYRVIVPLLIGVLMAGKCGASVAADVGARRLTHQYDAMRSFGVKPAHYLYGNVVIAMLLGGPLLTVVAYATNCYAALVAFLLSAKQATPAVFRRNFFSTVWNPSDLLPRGTGWVLLKAATGGLLIAALSYAIGSRRKASSVDVSRDVSLTIFWASLAVLALHSFYSFVEF